MKPFFPNTGSEAEWNAAYYRLEDYLRALHVVNKVHQGQIIGQLVRRAAEKHAQNPERSPTALVLEEADLALEQWFARILATNERVLVKGYVALLIADGAERWPGCLLADDVPPEFQQAMRANDLQAGPDLQVSSMVPRRIDVPLVAEFLKETKTESQKGAVLVTLITVVTIITLILLFFGI